MADASKYPTRIPPFGLRMPDDLKARVQAAAEAANRSMNAEIVATLEEKYPAPKPKTATENLLVIKDMLDAAWHNKDLTEEAKFYHLSAAGRVLDLLTLKMTADEVEAELGDWELLGYLAALLSPKKADDRDKQGSLDLWRAGEPSGIMKLINRNSTRNRS